MLRALLLSAVVLATVPGSLAAADSPTHGAAAAATPVAEPCGGEGWEQRRGRAAFSGLPDPRRWRFRVVFSGERSGYYAMTRVKSRTIEIYVRSCERQPDALLRHVVAHELGHAHDAARLDRDDRAEWLRVRGIPADTPWYGCAQCPDFDTPAGDYAEAYAQWLRGDETNHSTLAPAPTASTLAYLGERFFTR